MRTLVINKLNISDAAVEQAMLCLYRRQTSDEQSSGNTQHTNGRGFNYTHAKTGTYCAKWILKGNRLSGRFLPKCRKMAIFYSKQLAEDFEFLRSVGLLATTPAPIAQSNPYDNEDPTLPADPSLAEEMTRRGEEYLRQEQDNPPQQSLLVDAFGRPFC